MRRVVVTPGSGVIGAELRAVGRCVSRWLLTLVLLTGASASIASVPAAKAGEIRAVQSKLIGAWQFVQSINTRKDGTTFDRWGPNPIGMLIFDGAGHYSQMITSQDWMFGAKTIASFGRYSIEPGGKAILTKIEGSTSNKAVGNTQRRIIITLTGDELRYLIPFTTAGNQAEVVWKRLTPGEAAAVR